MTKRRKAPADQQTSTYIDPQGRAKKIAEAKTLDQRSKDLAGPVEVRKMKGHTPTQVILDEVNLISISIDPKGMGTIEKVSD